MSKSHQFAKTLTVAVTALYLYYLYLARIHSFVCKYKLINMNQFCFCSNHSTEHTLISLIETIKKSLDSDEIVCRIFTDSQKAFDTVSHKVLLEKLNHYGVRSN